MIHETDLDRARLVAYYDKGESRVSQERLDTEWIDDEDLFPEAEVDRKLFRKFREYIQQAGAPVRRYLSVGSGIGRHIALAHEIFPEISRVTSIDWKTPLHPSVLRLGFDIQVCRMIAFDAIEKLAADGCAFDLVCFENIGDKFVLTRTKNNHAYGALAQIVAPGGFVGVVGDAFLFEDSLISHGFAPIQGIEGDFGPPMQYLLWQKQSA